MTPIKVTPCVRCTFWRRTAREFFARAYKVIRPNSRARSNTRWGWLPFQTEARQGVSRGGTALRIAASVRAVRIATPVRAVCVRSMLVIGMALTAIVAMGSGQGFVGDHSVSSGQRQTLAFALLGAPAAQAKTPGRRYCFRSVCHRVKTLSQTRKEIGKVRSVIASYYDNCRRDSFNPCGLTASGERFRAHMPDNAASPEYPNGTVLLVRNPRNSRTAVVRINNAGPYWKNRRLDLSRAAARKLGFRGIVRLQVSVLKAPSRSEARYRRNRQYSRVPGYIGQHRSIRSAMSYVRNRHAKTLGLKNVKVQLASRESAKAKRKVAQRKVAHKKKATSGIGKWRTVVRVKGKVIRVIASNKRRASRKTRKSTSKVKVASRSTQAQATKTSANGTVGAAHKGGAQQWFRESVSAYQKSSGKTRVLRQSQKTSKRSEAPS